MGVYTRISRDAAGHELGVQRQEQDCRDLAKRLGWNVTKVYKENDTSAFKRQTVDLPGGGRALRVVRPEFRQMIEDLNEGRIDGLIAYDLDRVARDPRDLEDLIDLEEVRGCEVKSVTGGGAGPRSHARHEDRDGRERPDLPPRVQRADHADRLHGLRQRCRTQRR